MIIDVSGVRAPALKVRRTSADDTAVTDAAEQQPTLGQRLTERWERRRTLDAGEEFEQAALATAKGRERLRKRWAKARYDLARGPYEDLRFTVIFRIPAPPEVVWRALVDPAGPQASHHAPLLVCGTFPGPPPDAVGARVCTAMQEPSGDVVTTLDEVVHVEPGRRLTRASLQTPFRTLTGWWLEPEGPDATLVRGFTQLRVPRRCGWISGQLAESHLRRRAWALSAGVAGPQAAGPQPAHAPIDADAIRRRAEGAEQLARGPRVVVSASATAELTGVGVHAAWLAVCSVVGPTAEQGDPEAHWFPLRDGPAGATAALRCSVTRHPLGHLTTAVEEVVEWSPGVRIVTRSPAPLDVQACVELTPGPAVTTVEVRTWVEVLPDAAKRAQRILALRAHTNAARIDRQARGGEARPLDEVWFP